MAISKLSSVETDYNNRLGAAMAEIKALRDAQEQSALRLEGSQLRLQQAEREVSAGGAGDVLTPWPAACGVDCAAAVCACGREPPVYSSASASASPIQLEPVPCCCPSILLLRQPIRKPFLNPVSLPPLPPPAQVVQERSRREEVTATMTKLQAALGAIKDEIQQRKVSDRKPGWGMALCAGVVHGYLLQGF